MNFIDELRKCDPNATIRAPTLEEDPNRKWIYTPIGQFLEEWDNLVASRNRYKQKTQFLEQTLSMRPAP